MPAATVPPQSLVGTERIACVLRLAVGVLGLAMALHYEPFASWLAVTAIVTSVAWSALMAVALHTRVDADQLSLLATGSHWFDIALSLGVYAIFISDPMATPVAALPLLVYRLAVRYGRAGVVGGAVVFGALVGTRIAVNRVAYGEGLVRPPLLLAWALVALLVLLLAVEARARAASTAASMAASMVASPAPGPPEDTVASTGDERLDTLAVCLSLSLDTHQAMATLTQRELEVLLLLGEGHAYGAVASRLFISQSTVRNHVHNIRAKLEIADRTEMLTLARALVARRRLQAGPQQGVAGDLVSGEAQRLGDRSGPGRTSMSTSPATASAPDQ